MSTPEKMMTRAESKVWAVLGGRPLAKCRECARKRKESSGPSTATPAKKKAKKVAKKKEEKEEKQKESAYEIAGEVEYHYLSVDDFTG
eukprot:scaffold20.g7615.t1